MRLDEFLSDGENFGVDEEVIVCKFGGWSVANAEKIKKVEDIVKSDDRRKYIVVSAPGKDKGREYKVTDLLYNLYFKSHPDVDDSNVKYQRIEEPVEQILNRIQDVYSNISQGLGLNGELYRECMDELEIGMDYENSTYHDMASKGEKFNARLIAEYLDAEFIDATDLIYIPDSCPDGDNDISMKRVGGLKNKNNRIIITGFYGESALFVLRKVRTFSRGGADLTGALIAAGGGSIF